MELSGWVLLFLSSCSDFNNGIARRQCGLLPSIDFYIIYMLLHDLGLGLGVQPFNLRCIFMCIRLKI